MPPTASLPPRPRLVLRMGITGHRPTPSRPLDVSAIHAVMLRVMSIADELLLSVESLAYDLTLPRRLTLLSALAAGADQMAAHVFQELPPRSGRECRLEAILPFPMEAYAATIEDPANVARMRTLAEGADRLFLLSDFVPPPSGPHQDPPDTVAMYRQNRRYETVGRIVVHQSDVLIAVWNGKPSEGLGGTGDIVLYAVRHGVPVVWIGLDGETRLIPAGTMRGDPFEWIFTHSVSFTPETLKKLLHAAVYPPHVKVYDENGKNKQASRYSLEEYLQEDESTFRRNWSFYNFLLASPAGRLVSATSEIRVRGPRGLWMDARSSWRTPTDYVRRSMQEDWKGYPSERPSDEQFRFGLAWSSADAIATGLGHAYRSTYILVLLLSFLAVTFGLVGIVLHEYKPWFVATELTVLFAALSLYHHSRDRGLHERWLQTREIAELLRAAWAPLMLGGGGRRSSRDGKRHWSAWLSNAYLAEAGLPSLELSSDVLGRIAEAALLGIAEDQEAYHLKNTRVLRAIHHRLERIGRRSLMWAIGNSLLLLVFLILFHNFPEYLGDIESHERLILAMAAISATLPTLGATAAALRFQGDFERFGQRSQQTSRQLREVSEQLRAFIRTVQEDTQGAAFQPRFEALFELFTSLESSLIADLDDWRFVYITRTMPEPS